MMKIEKSDKGAEAVYRIDFVDESISRGQGFILRVLVYAPNSDVPAPTRPEST